MTDDTQSLLALARSLASSDPKSVSNPRIKLYKIKLKRFLVDPSPINLTDLLNHEDRVDLFNAIINYSDRECIEAAYLAVLNTPNSTTNMSAELLRALYGLLPLRICMPLQIWNPQNFLVKSEDKEIDPTLLEEEAKRNEGETEWLKTKLLPNKHAKSTFVMNKPMVLQNREYVSKISDLVKRKIIMVSAQNFDLRHLDLLLKYRLKQDCLVRICLVNKKSNKYVLYTEFWEWISTKFDIPLIKVTLDYEDDSMTDAELFESIVGESPDVRFDNNDLWSYGLSLSGKEKISLSNIKVIQKDPHLNPKEAIKQLNERNVPFLS